MTVLIITLFVCTTLMISYYFFSKEISMKKELQYNKRIKLNNYYILQLNNINNLPLLGIGIDENSDFKFKEAVKKIKLPDDTKVRIYD